MSPLSLTPDLKSEISVEDHIARAQHYFGSNNIDTAISELTHAVNALKDSQARVEHTVDTAIRALSTFGGRADPPHPKALALIKLRMTLAAP